MSFVVIAAKDKIPLLPWANVLHTHPQDRDDSPTKCRMVRNTKVRRLSNRMHLHTRDTVIICTVHMYNRVSEVIRQCPLYNKSGYIKTSTDSHTNP